MTDRVVVTGASGILGDAILRSRLLPDAVGIVHERPSAHPSVEADLRDPVSVAAVLGELRPRAVVHTVALTDVDACERDPGTAFALAAATTHTIATWLAAHEPDALLVYVSSDQVYAGTGPHHEERTQPLNTYGQSKRAGELAAAQAPRSLVLRTNFFGHSEMRASYTDWLALAVREGREIPVDPAAAFSALHLADLVALLAAAVDEGIEGTFNLAAHDSMRKLDFARAVAGIVAEAGTTLVVELAGDPQRAPRPLDLRLDVSRIEGALGRRMPSMADGLERVRAELREVHRAA